MLACCYRVESRPSKALPSSSGSGGGPPPDGGAPEAHGKRPIPRRNLLMQCRSRRRSRWRGRRRPEGGTSEAGRGMRTWLWSAHGLTANKLAVETMPRNDCCHLHTGTNLATHRERNVLAHVHVHEAYCMTARLPCRTTALPRKDLLRTATRHRSQCSNKVITVHRPSCTTHRE